MGTVYEIHVLSVLASNSAGKSVATPEAWFELGKSYGLAAAVHSVLERDWTPPAPPEGSREGMHGTLLVPTGQTNASGSPLYRVRTPETRQRGVTRELREVLEYSQHDGLLWTLEDPAVCEVLTLEQLCRALREEECEAWARIRALQFYVDALHNAPELQSDNGRAWLAILVGN